MRLLLPFLNSPANKVEARAHPDLDDLVRTHQAELKKTLGVTGASYSKKSKGIRFYESKRDIKADREKWPSFIDWQVGKVLKLQTEMVRLEKELGGVRASRHRTVITSDDTHQLEER